MKRILRPVRLVGLFVRVNVLNELQYRANFFVQLLQSALALATGLVVLALVFGRTATLGGWTRPQLLAVMGIFTAVGGIVRAFIEPNMQRLAEDVRTGLLDHTLTKPSDAQLLLSVRRVELWQLVDVVLGGGVLAVALVQLRSTIGFAQAVSFVVALVLGAILVYCFWLVITTAVFWVVRIGEMHELFEGVFRAGQYPVGIYPGWLRVGLTFLVPIAFAVTVPSQAVTGRLSGRTLALAAIFTLFAFVASRWLFRRGIKRYAGASA